MKQSYDSLAENTHFKYENDGHVYVLRKFDQHNAVDEADDFCSVHFSGHEQVEPVELKTLIHFSGGHIEWHNRGHLTLDQVKDRYPHWKESAIEVEHYEGTLPVAKKPGSKT